ncbi:24881_t:CDS:1, partial [Dentiscutata erythropus]
MTSVDPFYVQRIARRSGNRYYVCKICGSYQRNRSIRHINEHTPQQRAYQRNIFHRYIYTPRQITTSSTSNQPEQITNSPTASSLRRTTGSPRQTTTGTTSNQQIPSQSNQPIPVVDIRPEPESQTADVVEESSDSTRLPVEFSEESTDESSDDSYREEDNKRRK